MEVVLMVLPVRPKMPLVERQEHRERIADGARRRMERDMATIGRSGACQHDNHDRCKGDIPKIGAGCLCECHDKDAP